MIKQVSIIVALILLMLISTRPVLALDAGDSCILGGTLPNGGCDTNQGLVCLPMKDAPAATRCQLRRGAGEECNPNWPISNGGCDTNQGLVCLPMKDAPAATRCQPGQAGIDTIFGKISPPFPLNDMLKDDPTGAGAISKFLSNGINLIYLIAAIVLIFMIIWGAFQWLTSGGDKEQLAAAQRRIIHAIIGIIIFAAAFAIITLLGQFTGFKFFKGQGVQVIRRNEQTDFQEIRCADGQIIWSGIEDPAEVCARNGH